MVTRKLTALALCCLALFSSCDKDDSSAEVEQLEKELIAEKGKTVVDLRKEGDNLIIVYSNGTTSTVPYTDAMKGNIGGQDGKDGVGIESITYNEETGMLTIKLTNGEVTAFKITANGTAWDAVLVGDTNGSLFITEALMGSVPVLKAEYNDAYQLTYLESNRAVDMQTRKAFDLTKTYTNGTLDKLTLNKYATEDIKDQHAYEYVSERYNTQVTFAAFKQYTFKEQNGDGTFAFYMYDGERNGEHRYRKYAKCISVPSSSAEYDTYEVIRKHSDTEYYYYQSAHSSSEERIYALNHIITILPDVAAGDLRASVVSDVETDSQGRVIKSYEGSAEGSQSTKYISYEYNAAGLVKTSKTYLRNAQGNWSTTGEIDSYTYNAENRLTSVTRTFTDGSTAEVQKAVYDSNGNPTAVWAWQPAVYDHSWKLDVPTGQWVPTSKLIRAAGLHKVADIEYETAYKNFLGNTITALVPELEGYRIVNAIKRVTVPNSYTFANIEYKDFNENGYPRRMKMDASYIESDDTFSINYEVVLNYKVKSK
ncbi:hypothetical protein [Pontibacter arcticus]|uniref:YD repeat-containing protein n=1 Tax=Pontibacter arcticus TaxID=2080288 RepID=A0A364RAM6_9BACT|nr:hypothetical protein [Pontibacter arcticus]RAU81333.1 hypothetical protein DP923_15985 [Pontibacter arcticus]RAU81398.1 hypothetical protein DP923_16330 [Pontibacter arcticus]